MLYVYRSFFSPSLVNNQWLPWYSSQHSSQHSSQYSSQYCRQSFPVNSGVFTGVLLWMLIRVLTGVLTPECWLERPRVLTKIALTSWSVGWNVNPLLSTLCGKYSSQLSNQYSIIQCMLFHFKLRVFFLGNRSFPVNLKKCKRNSNLKTPYTLRIK